MNDVSEIFKEYEITKRKIDFFQNHLIRWYGENGREFPWRKKGLTHYQYIIAEVLLQRTKAETIAIFFPKFVAKYPNWKALSNADHATLEEYLKPIGLQKQRSHRLMMLAREMSKRNSQLPKSRTDLESIPFFGQYITNAVELLIYDIPSPLIDVNMSRLLERFFGKRKKADIRYDPYLQILSHKIVQHSSAKHINWAILDFAAIQCKPTPLCSSCILKKQCMEFQLCYQK